MPGGNPLPPGFYIGCCPEFPPAALRREFVDRAFVARAAMHGGAVEIAGAVAHHAVISVGAVGRAGETVHDAFAPLVMRAGHQLENHAVAVRTPFAGGAVEIAARIEIHIRDGARAIAAALETVEQAFLPRAAPGRELIHSADIIPPG